MSSTFISFEGVEFGKDFQAYERLDL